MKAVLFALLALGTGLALISCGGSTVPDNEALELAFAQGRTGVWVSGHGEVVRELGSEASSQRFQVRVNNDFNLVIRHRIGSAGPVPVERGDRVSFHGRYEFHGGGGELTLTHSDPAQPGGGGWILHRDIRYH